MAKQIQLSVAERRALAHRSLEQFGFTVKKLEEYSKNNRTLIARAAKESSKSAQFSRSILAQLGIKASREVTGRTEGRQRKRGEAILAPPRKVKPQTEGPGAGAIVGDFQEAIKKRNKSSKPYLITREVKDGLKYKIITSLFPLFPNYGDIPSEDIYAYFKGEQLALIEYGDYIHSPDAWVSYALAKEYKGLDFGYVRAQGIKNKTGEYGWKKANPKSGRELEIKYDASGTGRISTVEDKASIMFKHFGLVKWIRLTLRQAQSKRKIKT